MILDKLGFVFALLLALFSSINFAQSSQSQNVGACAGNVFGVNGIAPWYCSNINQIVYSQWQQWAPLGFIVITVAFSIAALIFALGVGMKNQRLREFGIGEIYEASASAIILFLFMMIAAVMLGIVPASFTGPSDPYVTSLNYITSTIMQTNTLLTSLFNTYALSAYFTSFSLNVNVGDVSKINTGQNIVSGLQSAQSYFSKINPVFGAVIDALFLIPAQTLAYLLMDGLLILHVEYYLILFGMYAGIPVFLLPGIVLRAFIPTRALGGMLISIAIGFFFVMPLLFSVAYYFTSNQVGSMLTSTTQQINQYSQGVGAQQNAISPSSPLVTTLQNFQNSMGAFWLEVLFYPALIVAMTYFSIITMADFIGGFGQGTSRFIGQL